MPESHQVSLKLNNQGCALCYYPAQLGPPCVCTAVCNASRGCFIPVSEPEFVPPPVPNFRSTS